MRQQNKITEKKTENYIQNLIFPASIQPHFSESRKPCLKAGYVGFSIRSFLVIAGEGHILRFSL